MVHLSLIPAILLSRCLKLKVSDSIPGVSVGKPTVTISSVTVTHICYYISIESILSCCPRRQPRVSLMTSTCMNGSTHTAAVQATFLGLRIARKLVS